MKVLWCWRCGMDVPMLDDAEYETAMNLLGKGMRGPTRTFEERVASFLDYYEQVGAVRYTVPGAVLHHRISIYGPPCETCGKPYRTPKASFCAACGRKRMIIV